MPNVRHPVITDLIDCGIIAVLRGIESSELPHISEALVDGGVTGLEITADSPDAADMIQSLATRYATDDVRIGAGTVLDSQTTQELIDAGAEFIVSPAVREGVINTASNYDIPVIPGIMTPTEGMRAYDLGATTVKLFPATTLGSAHLSAMQGPLPHLSVVPTGGISLENGAAFLESGAAALGVGSALVDDALVSEQRWEELRSRARAYCDLVHHHRETR